MARGCRWPTSPNASGACWPAVPCAPSASTNSRAGRSAARLSTWSAASPSGRASMASITELRSAAALPRKPGIDIDMDAMEPHDPDVIVTWGHQVVIPGTTAGSTELPDEDLGLALVGPRGQRVPGKMDAANYLFPVILQNNSAEWYAAAMWDQENTEALTVNAATPADRNNGGSLVPNAQRATRQRFAALMHETSVRLADPAQIRWAPAPPAEVKPAEHRTYAQALALLQNAADRTAHRFEPLIAAGAPESYTKGTGFGFWVVGLDPK